MNVQKQFGFASVVVILVIIGVLILGGGVWYYLNKTATEKIEPQVPQPTQPEEETERIEEIKSFDCGTDEDCFYSQLKTCTVSVTKSPVNPLGLRFQFDIQGEKENNCLIQVSTIETPEDFPQLKDTEMQCKIPKGSSKGMLAQIVGMDVTKKSQINCKGNLMDLMLTDQSVILGIMMVLNWGNLEGEIETELTPEMLEKEE